MGKQLTYQELLAAYNKLLKENEFLHKEVITKQQGYSHGTTNHKTTFVFG